jgi:hypothetical protein
MDIGQASGSRLESQFHEFRLTSFAPMARPSRRTGKRFLAGCQENLSAHR